MHVFICAFVCACVCVRVCVYVCVAFVSKKRRHPEKMIDVDLPSSFFWQCDVRRPFVYILAKIAYAICSDCAAAIGGTDRSGKKKDIRDT